jgi:hypothetical protein
MFGRRNDKKLVVIWAKPISFPDGNETCVQMKMIALWRIFGEFGRCFGV